MQTRRRKRRRVCCPTRAGENFRDSGGVEYRESDTTKVLHGETFVRVDA